jgi:glycosyltransferase involved in cell wall biosynthesis
MKIAYVCADPGVPVYGGQKGCSIHVQEMIHALTSLGHDVYLHAANLGNAEADNLCPVPTHKLPRASRALSRTKRERYSVLANTALRRALITNGPFDLVYERYSLWSFAAMRWSREGNIPGVLEVNAPLIREQARYRGLVDQKSANKVVSRCFRDAQVITAVSREVADYVGEFPDTRNKTYVLPNGVNPTRFKNMWSQPRSTDLPFTVGFVGSLKPWHGIEVLVEAFENIYRHNPDSHLLIVGDGPVRHQIEASLRAKGLESSATLTGIVDPSQIPALLGQMDVAIAPYPALDDFYFSPMKIFEYMAAGLPIIASSVGQVAEIITDEVHGLLCPPGNAAALTESLLCLRNDISLRCRLGLAARAKVFRQHTWQQVAERMIDATAPAPLSPAMMVQANV